MALFVQSVSTQKWPAGDSPGQNLFGVQATVYIAGTDPTGTEKLRIIWGNVGFDDIPVNPNLHVGINTISNSLPAGSHNICADIVM